MGRISGYYLLLTLARIRMRETAEQCPPQECGWVHREDLIEMLQCPETQLNLWVHRIRSRFSSQGFLDYAAVIERRDGSGQMRIGASSFIIQ
jgi:hypothetical protein